MSKAVPLRQGDAARESGNNRSPGCDRQDFLYVRNGFCTRTTAHAGQRGNDSVARHRRPSRTVTGPEVGNPDYDMENDMNWLLWAAIILVVLWVLAEVLGFVLGALLHLLWIAAIILFVMWLIGKFRART